MGESVLLSLVGAKIREIRKNKGLTQEKLGEKAGFHFSYIGRIERGQKNISLSTLNDLATALGVGVHEFFGYEYEYSRLSEKDQHIRDILEILIKRDNQDVRNVKNSIKGLFSES